MGEGLTPPRTHKFRVKDSEEAESLTERGVATITLALGWAGPVNVVFDSNNSCMSLGELPMAAVPPGAEPCS